jgi:hypothetical protein
MIAITILFMLLIFAQTSRADRITDPSTNFQIIDFEALSISSHPVTFGELTFTSIMGHLFIFDISHWPAHGTEISSRALATGGVEPDSAISIEFARPVAEFLLGWGDPNFQGNVLRAFDASGNLLEESGVALGPPGGGHAAWIGFRRSTADISMILV